MDTSSHYQLPNSNYLPFNAGVSATSAVAFKSNLMQAHTEAQLVAEGALDADDLRARRKGSMASLLEKKNAGVADRDQRDRLHIKVGVAVHKNLWMKAFMFFSRP